MRPMRSPSETVKLISRNKVLAPKAFVKPCALRIGGILQVYRDFLERGAGAFLQGVFEKSGGKWMVFCGEVLGIAGNNVVN